MENEYKYLVLRHQPSLYQEEKENFAVLVEGKIGNNGLVLVVGRAPRSTKGNEITESVSQRIPDILESLIRQAAHDKKPQEDVLDWVSHSMSWNFSASEAHKLQDQEPISAVGFKLFSQYVAGTDNLVDLWKAASRQMIQPLEAKMLIGDMFLNFLQVPGPEMVMSASR